MCGTLLGVEESGGELFVGDGVMDVPPLEPGVVEDDPPPDVAGAGVTEEPLDGLFSEVPAQIQFLLLSHGPSLCGVLKYKLVPLLELITKQPLGK